MITKEELKTWRITENLTQPQAASRLEVKLATYKTWESLNSKSKVPSWLEKILATGSVLPSPQQGKFLVIKTWCAKFWSSYILVPVPTYVGVSSLFESWKESLRAGGGFLNFELVKEFDSHEAAEKELQELIDKLPRAY